MDVGYAFSSEEHMPLDLVRNARRDEDPSFAFAVASDHYQRVVVPALRPAAHDRTRERSAA